MKKSLLFSLLAIVLVFSGHAQNPRWNAVPAVRLEQAPKVDRDSQPMEFKLFHVDYNELKAKLAQAPSRDSGVESNVVVQFPAPNGELNRFKIYEASVMHPELAARYPEIQSYVGQNLDAPAETIRISTTIFGMHMMASTANGTYYIDPYTKDLSNYIVYEKSKLKTTRVRQCLVEDTPESTEGLRMASESMLASDSKFRTYRMAMACTVEYAAYHITAANLTAAAPLSVRKAAVLAAMNVTVGRLNQVYERDMSLTLQLVPNNDIIIFVTSDTFNNDNANVLINQSQSVIDANIGTANYDIGHTVSTGGGGLAQSPSVCITGKARGITGSPAPVGDPFDIDFVAHEVGHQFGASHTFNGIGGNCDETTRANAFAVEPGSGSTIMAYAGICSPVDVQPNSDAHFHAVSIAQMVTHITGAGNCVAGVNNNNTPPVANAGANFTIPKGTAFVLKGSATDANNPNTLTYCWEQTNNQISTQPPLATSTTGPNFRSFPPSTSPNRYMPKFADVMAGNLTPTWEVVPNVARTMNFALTVRDNAPTNGGQTHRDDMVVTVANVGPFRITYPDQTNVNLGVGATQTITWDVAGTTGNGINTSNVNILISTDNGVTFTPLVSNTPNDGSETVTLPSVAAPYCRIMIESVGNIFYALSKSFTMGYTIETTCETYTATPNSTIQIGPDGPTWYLMGPGITATSSNPISDMNVTVNLTHANVGELAIGIAPPGATQGSQVVVLYQGNCNSGANMNVEFDDQGAVFNCSVLNAGNAYQPNTALSVFNGTLPTQNGGGWRIVVADFVAANNGVMNSYTFEFCSTTTTLAIADYGLSNFVLYPNPNNGSFNVSFDSASSGDISIGVHDMGGRKIYDKSFQNTGAFNQQVQLDGLQTGVYIVTVQDGDRKEVKRIVIE